MWAIVGKVALMYLAGFGLSVISVLVFLKFVELIFIGSDKIKEFFDSKL